MSQTGGQRYSDTFTLVFPANTKAYFVATSFTEKKSLISLKPGRPDALRTGAFDRRRHRFRRRRDAHLSRLRRVRAAASDATTRHRRPRHHAVPHQASPPSRIRLQPSANLLKLLIFVVDVEAK
jgi:hypothetical protein